MFIYALISLYKYICTHIYIYIYVHHYLYICISICTYISIDFTHYIVFQLRLIINITKVIPLLMNQCKSNSKPYISYIWYFSVYKKSLPLRPDLSTLMAECSNFSFSIYIYSVISCLQFIFILKSKLNSFFILLVFIYI